MSSLQTCGEFTDSGLNSLNLLPNFICGQDQYIKIVTILRFRHKLSNWDSLFVVRVLGRGKASALDFSSLGHFHHVIVVPNRSPTEHHTNLEDLTKFKGIPD